MFQVLDMDVRSDPAGDGHYHARRDGGSRLHDGIDYECTPGARILSTVDGEITKLGYAYDSDLRWRYVQVTDHAGRRHRLFYVEPTVEVGQVVEAQQAIGTAQDITVRYAGTKMKPHVHYEIKDAQGAFQDPGAFGASNEWTG